MFTGLNELKELDRGIIYAVFPGYLATGNSLTKKWLGWVHSYTRWWFQISLFSPLPGEMIKFDEHIFQRGWFNHQLTSQYN